MIDFSKLMTPLQMCMFTATCLSGAAMAGTMGDVATAGKWMKNVYAGVDGGYSMSLNSTNFTPYNGASVATSGLIISTPGNTTFQREVGNAGMIGAFIGYRVDDNLSFNLNYDYRGGFGWQVPTNAVLTEGVSNLIYYVKDNIKPNAIKMIMCLVWLYSWALFQFAKATEFFFRNLIRFPEQLFIFVDILCSQPKNIDDKSIHVLSAFNETGDITNRFKLFLWKYWNTTREIHDENGVDIGKFIKLFNCTMLYCSYLLKDSSNLDQEYEKQVKRMLITKQEVKGKFQRFTKKDLKFASVSSSRDSQKSHDIINDEFLHDIIMEDANNELQSKETNLLFSHCTFE